MCPVYCPSAFINQSVASYPLTLILTFFSARTKPKLRHFWVYLKSAHICNLKKKKITKNNVCCILKMCPHTHIINEVQDRQQ